MYNMLWGLFLFYFFIFHSPLDEKREKLINTNVNNYQSGTNVAIFIFFLKHPKFLNVLR